MQSEVFRISIHSSQSRLVKIFDDDVPAHYAKEISNKIGIISRGNILLEDHIIIIDLG